MKKIWSFKKNDFIFPKQNQNAQKYGLESERKPYFWAFCFSILFL
jgi:hypothetical protein